MPGICLSRVMQRVLLTCLIACVFAGKVGVSEADAGGVRHVCRRTHLLQHVRGSECVVFCVESFWYCGRSNRYLGYSSTTCTQSVVVVVAFLFIISQVRALQRAHSRTTILPICFATSCFRSAIHVCGVGKVLTVHGIVGQCGKFTSVKVQFENIHEGAIYVVSIYGNSVQQKQDGGGEMHS